MPTYDLTSSKTGRTYQVDFASDPTPEDVDYAINFFDAEEPAAPAEQPGFIGQMGESLMGGGQLALGGGRTSLGVLTGDVPGMAAGLTQMQQAQARLQASQTPEDVAFAQDIAQQAQEMEQAEGFFPTLREAVDLPLAVARRPVAALRTAVQSLPNIAVTTPVTLAGAALGGVAGAAAGLPTTGPGAVLTGLAGAATTGAAANAAIEVGYALNDLLNERTGGASATMTEEQIAAYLEANPDIVDEAQRIGLTRGATIGAVEALGLKGAGRLTAAPARAAEQAARTALAREGVDLASQAAVRQAMATPALREAAETAAKAATDQFNLPARALGAVGIEAGAAAGGELAAQAAAGQELDYGEAFLETLGEGLAAPATVLAARRVEMPRGSVLNLPAEQAVQTAAAAMGDEFPSVEELTNIAGPEAASQVATAVADAGAVAEPVAPEAPVQEVQVQPEAVVPEVQPTLETPTPTESLPAVEAQAEATGQQPAIQTPDETEIPEASGLPPVQSQPPVAEAAVNLEEGAALGGGQGEEGQVTAEQLSAIPVGQTYTDPTGGVWTRRENQFGEPVLVTQSEGGQLRLSPQDVVAMVRRAAAPTQPPVSPATGTVPTESLPADTQPTSGDVGTVDALRAVATNTATPEQLDTLTQQGLARVVQGQPVITDAGVAMLPSEERPRLTEAERVAEIEGGGIRMSLADTNAEYTRLVEGGDSGTDNLSALIKAAPAADRASVIEQWTQRNPQSAAELQKMVEEAAKAAGYGPSVWWHGGKFDPNKDAIPRIKSGKKGKSNMQLDFGLHLASNKAESEAYLPNKGGAVTKLYLASENVGGEILDLSDSAIWVVSKADAKRFGKKVSALIEKQRAQNKDFGAVVDDVSGDIPVYPSQVEKILTSIAPSDAVEAVRNFGATGIKYTARANYGTGYYSPFDAVTIIGGPNQIKSADPITYDDQGNVIPLSQRFQTTSPDIRFSTNTPATEIPAPTRPLTGDAQRNETMARRRRGKPQLPTGLRTVDGAVLPGITPTLAQATQARTLEAQQTPGAQDTWIGTSEEYLAENPDATFVRERRDLEAFYDGSIDRAVILTDRVQVREGDAVRAARNGTSAALEAVRRLIRHESFVHRGWRALPENLKREFLSIAENVVPADDLDQLAKKLYKRFANWRNDPALRALAVEEWLAQRLERIEKLPAGSDSVLNQLVDWAKRVWQWLAGDDSVEPTRAELVDLMRQMVRALETGEKEQAVAVDSNNAVEILNRAIPTSKANIVESPDGTQIVGPVMFSIRAYHATPHKVDRFNLERIGTGEGIQVFGYGLYFAESEKVSGRGGKYDVQFSEKTGRPANIYTVDLLPDEASFLDWDSELSDEKRNFFATAFESIGWSYDAQQKAEQLRSGGYATGRSEYNALASIVGAKNASERLAAAGIPGIKYLDGISRTSREGTRNYVIFDENLVRILEENGQPVEQIRYSLAEEPDGVRASLADTDAEGYESGHFIGGVIPSNPRLPIFTTTDREGAEWYAENRGDGGQVYPIAISAKNSLPLNGEADIINLLPILDAAGVEYEFSPSSATQDWWTLNVPEVQNYSGYEGSNPLDVAYIPSVREELVRRGYDSLSAWDQLENTEIPVVVLVRSPSQLRFSGPVPTDIRFSLTGNEATIRRLVRDDRDDAESGVVPTRARPLAPGASPTSATEQINGQEIIERNQLQKTSLQRTKDRAIEIVDAIGPMDQWTSTLLNPAWQEQTGLNIRSPLGQYVIAEALNRVSNVSKKDRLRYGTLNDMLARQWQTGSTESATTLAARSGITSDPRYAALFTVQAMLEGQRKLQAGVIDPALGSTEGTVAATLNVDTQAQQQATEDVDSELRLKDALYELGLAGQNPDTQQRIRRVNDNVFRLGVLARLREQMRARAEQASFVSLSASAVEAEYAAMSVEQIDAEVARLERELQDDLAALETERRKVRTTKPKGTAKTVVEQAKDLIEKLEAAPGVKKTPKPNPVRDLYKAHLKQPMAEGDFVRAMVAIGVPEAEARKLYGLAAVKIAAAEAVAAQKESERQAREADKPTPAEAFAARTINEVANRLADPAATPAEKEQKVLPIRELYKEHVRDGLPLDVFVQRAVTAGIDEQTAFILHGVGTMERDAAETRRGYNEAGAAQRFAERVVDEAAARFADPALPQPVRAKRKNAIRELYAAHVKKPMGRDAFVEAARKLGVDERTAATMHGVGTMENEARAIQKDARNAEAEARRLNDRTARLLDTDKNSLENLINKLRPKITGGLNWREIFDRPLTNQREWRQQLFDTLRADPALANLSPAEVRDLAAELDRIWNAKREAAFKALAKRMNLPGAREGVKEKIAESAPALIRYINSGAFNDVNFRNAIADKFGVPQLDEARVDEVIALVQKAQEAKTQVERNKYMNQAIRLMQEGMKAEAAEVISNYWVTSVLSGFATLVDMALAVMSGQRILAQMSADSIIRQRDFKLAGRSAKRYFQTLGNAILESAYYVTSGDPSLLDNYQFTLDTYLKEGSAAANPFDYFERIIKDPNKSPWKKIVPYYFAGLQRIMTAFDHINSTATTQGVLEHAMAYNRDKYIDARMPSKEDVAEARAKAVALVGGDKTWAQKRLVSSYTRQNLNELLGERYPGLLDEAKDIGRIAAYQNDPTGIGGMVYHTLLGVTNKWVSAAATTRAEGRAQGDAQALTDKMMREVNFFLSVNSRNMTGTRFVRFVGNRVNELLSFTPGLGLVRLKEKGMTPTKRAMLIQNQVVGTMLSLWAAVTLLRMMEDEEDEEKRGMRVEGSWQGLTPDQRNQRRASGATPNTVGIWDGEKWVNFNYTPWPVASILATVGNISDIKRFHPEKWDAKDLLDKLATVVWSGAFSFKDLSAISGFVDLLGFSAYSSDPVDGTIKWLSKFSSNFVGGIIPRMLKDIDMIMDPEARRPGSPSEYFFKEVPFFRRLEIGGEKMYNIFGDPVQMNRLPWRRVVTASRPEREYQILAELNNRGLFLGVANPDNRTVGYGASRRELTDEEAERYSVETGKRYRQFILDQGERLLEMPEERAKEFISRRTEALRNAALRDAIRTQP